MKISGGGTTSRKRKFSESFAPSSDEKDVGSIISLAELPPTMIFDLHDSAEEDEVLHIPPMACVVREPVVLPEFSHSGVDPWEDINMQRYLRGDYITDIANDPAERRRIVLRASAYELNGDVLLRRMRNGTTRT
eukprot:1567458-Pyramimonas_sp.AAC.1